MSRRGFRYLHKEFDMRAMQWLMIPILVGAMGGVALADFKNLQVLPKTMSKDELKGYMKAQAKALGVECDFCHDVPDMASDKNEKKLIARKMIQMTNEVNAKWLKGMKDADKNKVTCATCHQGHELPPKQGAAPEKK
jgi:nitrate/TMAO reductase-like tetraheme cytochrome c subunit